MLIWLNLYFIIYICLMVSLYYLLSKITKNNFTKKSLVFAHFFILKYSKIKNIYLGILLSLAGLPPFLFFFIKSNYIVGFIGSISFASNMIIFICYYINMIFYTQIYLYKNYNFTDLDYMNTKTLPYDYKVVYKIVILLFFTALGFLFSADLYYIGNLLLI